MTSLTPEQAKAQRERAWLADERKAVVSAARTVIDQIRMPSGDDATVRALRSSGSDVMDLLAELNDAQREAERHDADSRDGDAALATYVAALRKPRDEAKEASGRYDRGTSQRSACVRRANAYTWAIKALIATGEAEIATVRREVAEAKALLGLGE